MKRAAIANYRDLTTAQATNVLREFLDERRPALERLRERLTVDGQDPDALLDGTPASLIPLWRWVLSSLTALTDPNATDPASAPRQELPSWERYTPGEEPILSLESLAVIDGLVSYVAEVVQERAPLARWEAARALHKRYVYTNRPVLVSGRGENHNFLPEHPLVHARGVLYGVRESPEDTMAEFARRLIEQLNRGDGNAANVMDPEPPFEVEDIRDEPGGYHLEIGLSDEIAHVWSFKVDRLVRKLAREEGIVEVLREDREVILVRAPSWSAEALERWLAPRLGNEWISAVVRKLRRE